VPRACIASRGNKSKRKYKNNLAKDHGKGARHGRLEQLECSEGSSQGQKSIVNQRGGLMHLLV